VEQDHVVQITVSGTREQAHAFLKRLASDDDFRARLEANPRTVLAENGIEFTPDDQFSVPETVNLPPKSELEQLLEEMGEPDETGMVNKSALGRACYAIVFKYGYAMPFTLPDGE
jgi:putative modified peptide